MGREAGLPGQDHKEGEGILKQGASLGPLRLWRVGSTSGFPQVEVWEPGHASFQPHQPPGQTSPSGMSSSLSLQGKKSLWPESSEDSIHAGFRNVVEGVLVTAISVEELQFSLVTQLCPTLGNPMDCSTPGFPVHRQLPELAQFNLMSMESVMPSNHLILCHPLLPLLSTFGGSSVLVLDPSHWEQQQSCGALPCVAGTQMPSEPRANNGGSTRMAQKEKRRPRPSGGQHSLLLRGI